MNKQIYKVDLKTNWFHLKRHVKGDVVYLQVRLK